MVLTGKEAEEFFRTMVAEEMRRREEMLAKAKEDAAVRGKEPFDLEKLETLCDTSYQGDQAPLEERRTRLEFQYYVYKPAMLTLEEFAAAIEEYNKW